MGLDYSLLPKASADPSPLTGSGKFYSKGPDGNVQAYYQDDSGNVYQLTPTGGGGSPNYQFIYDTGAVPSGNIYNDFATMMAAVAAVTGLKQIILLSDSPGYEVAGNFDFSNCELYSPFVFSVLRFSGLATITEMPYKMTNTLIAYRPTVVDHRLFDGAGSSNGLVVDLYGYSGFTTSVDPFNLPVGDTQGAMFALRDDTNSIGVYDQSFIEGASGTGAIPQWAMFRRSAPSIGVVKFNLNTTQGFLAPEPTMFEDAPGFEAQINGHGSVPLQAVLPTVGNVAYIRGAFGASYPNVQDGDYQTITVNVLADGNFGFSGFFFARNVRFELDANHIITSFDNPYNGWDITRGFAPQVREGYNVSAFNLTIQNNASIVCTTGADIVVLPGGGVRLWFDPISALWRASPMQ